MSQALKIRLPDGRSVIPTDWTSTPLWSTVEIASGVLTPLDGFSYGLGGDVPGSLGPRRSTQRDTNFEGAGSILAENEELLLYSIQIQLTQVVSDLPDYFESNDPWVPDPPFVSATNLVKVQRSTMVVLKIANTKEYIRMPISFFGAAMGVAGTLGAARAAEADALTYTEGVFIGQNGSSNAGGNRQFATPHRVGGGEAFAITLEFPYGGVLEPIGNTDGLNFGTDTGARIRASIYAVGVRKRPVA